MTRAEQKAAARASLIKAAVDELAQYGYQGTRIERIAERAGVTTGALYTHFTSKDALVAAVYETATARRVDEVAKLSDATTTQDAASGLGTALETWLAGHLADPRWFRIGVDIVLTQANHPNASPELRRARRELRHEVARRLAALAERSGRQLTVPADELAAQVLAFGNGTVLEHLADPANFVEGRFGRAIERLFDASTEPRPPPQPRRRSRPTG